MHSGCIPFCPFRGPFRRLIRNDIIPQEYLPPRILFWLVSLPNLIPLDSTGFRRNDRNPAGISGASIRAPATSHAPASFVAGSCHSEQVHPRLSSAPIISAGGSDYMSCHQSCCQTMRNLLQNGGILLGQGTIQKGIFPSCLLLLRSFLSVNMVGRRLTRGL